MIVILQIAAVACRILPGMKGMQFVGTCFSNIFVRGPEQKQIAALLQAWGQRCYISPERNACSLLCYEDLQTGEDYLAYRLSKQLACVTWRVMVHDDDVLHYEMYQNGILQDRFNSHPGWNWSEEWMPAEGGNARAMSVAFNAEANEAEITSLLDVKPPGTDGALVFESERAEKLALALGIPVDLNISTHFHDFERGYVDTPGWVYIEGRTPDVSRQWVIVNVPSEMQVWDVFEPVIMQQNAIFPYKIGPRDEVRAQLGALLPEIDFSDERFAWWGADQFSVEFDFGFRPVVTSISLEVRGNTEAAFPHLHSWCKAQNWRAFDVSGDWIA